VIGETASISDERALRSPGVLRKHAGAALALAVSIALFDALWNFGFWPAGLTGGLEWFGYNLIIAPSFVLSIFAAALVAERATARGVHYAMAWSVAVAAGCLIATCIEWLILDKVFDWNVFASGELLMRGADKATWTRQQQPIWALLTWSIPAIPSALLYAHWRRAVQVRSRLYAAELGRAETERHVLEAQLQATQARVEPQFLFDTLASLKKLKECNPARAMAQLDSLIAYLRAALPRLNDTRSTLAQELDLCRAYLDLATIAHEPQWSFVIEAPMALASASMPAMVLLPLIVRAAASHRPSAGPLTLRADFHQDRLRITLRANANIETLIPPDLRDRLRALYGDRAEITGESIADGSIRVTVEIPFGAPSAIVVADDRA